MIRVVGQYYIGHEYKFYFRVYFQHIFEVGVVLVRLLY